jgi:hypothetical protein
MNKTEAACTIYLSAKQLNCWSQASKMLTVKGSDESTTFRTTAFLHPVHRQELEITRKHNRGYGIAVVATDSLMVLFISHPLHVSVIRPSSGGKT